MLASALRLAVCLIFHVDLLHILDNLAYLSSPDIFTWLIITYTSSIQLYDNKIIIADIIFTKWRETVSSTESKMKTRESASETKGQTIRWAHLYDPIVRLALLGQDKALRKMTIKMAQIKPGDRVLDAGCGTGDLTIAAKVRAGSTGKVFGIDAAPEMVEASLSKAAMASLDIEFRVGLIESLPFPNDYFDVVLSSLMMHHLPDDLKHKGLAEIYRVLKPGGHLIVVDMNRPTVFPIKILTAFLVHEKMDTGAQDLPLMMNEVGFSQIESKNTWFGLLGFVRGEVHK